MKQNLKYDTIAIMITIIELFHSKINNIFYVIRLLKDIL